MKYISLLIAGLFITQANAQVIPFSVNAGDDGYTGWIEGNTGGPAVSGTFIGSSGTGMDVGGDSWGLYSNSFETSARFYDFGGTLDVGQSVSISASIGFIDAGGTIGFALQNSSAVNRFESYYIGGDSDSWKINDAGGQEDTTGVSDTFDDSSWNTGSPSFLTFQFTQLGSDQYSLSVDGTNITNSDLTLAASDISRIRIFAFNAGSGASGSNDQFFNSLAVIPEPSSLLLLGISGLALGIFSRRRSRI